MSADDQKRHAGEAAALRVEAGMVVGLGTGSTAAWFVKALAARGLDGLLARDGYASVAAAVGTGRADWL